MSQKPRERFFFFMKESEFSNWKVITDLNDRISIKKYKWNSNCGGLRNEEVAGSIAYSCVKVCQEE